MHHVFLHIWKNGWTDNRPIDLSYIPVAGDTLALTSDGPWYLIKHRTIIGFKADFEAELWVKKTSNIDTLGKVEKSIK